MKGIEALGTAFPSVAVGLLLIGISLIVWSGWEMYRLNNLNRLCATATGQTVEFLAGCPYVEAYPFGSLQRFGIVLSGIGVVSLLLGVLRFRTPRGPTVKV